MQKPWVVITEVALIRRVKEWGEDAQRRLRAVQAVFREDGPEAFGLDAAYLTGCPSWDEITSSVRTDFFVEIGTSYLLLELEIRPGNTVVFRRVTVE